MNVCTPNVLEAPNIENEDYSKTSFSHNHFFNTLTPTAVAFWDTRDENIDIRSFRVGEGCCNDPVNPTGISIMNRLLQSIFSTHTLCGNFNTILYIAVYSERTPPLLSSCPSQPASLPFGISAACLSCCHPSWLYIFIDALPVPSSPAGLIIQSYLVLVAVFVFCL